MHIYQKIIVDQQMENILLTIYLLGDKHEIKIPLAKYEKLRGGLDIRNGFGIMIDLDTNDAIPLEYDTVGWIHEENK